MVLRLRASRGDPAACPNSNGGRRASRQVRWPRQRRHRRAAEVTPAASRIASPETGRCTAAAVESSRTSELRPVSTSSTSGSCEVPWSSDTASWSVQKNAWESGTNKFHDCSHKQNTDVIVPAILSDGQTITVTFVLTPPLDPLPRQSLRGGGGEEMRPLFPDRFLATLIGQVFGPALVAPLVDTAE